MIGQTISHYKITARLGEGGMGEVYLADDLQLGRKVAIKFLSTEHSTDEDSRSRFLHEARAEAMLSHPNIVTFHEVGEAGGRTFLVMEYVEGETLSDYVRSERLNLNDILALVIQVGEGLQAAHDKDVIHRDIKPENIMVTHKGHVKITDFGLARWTGATTLTKSGTRLGTAYYMSPEQAEGKRVDHRSDVFSLGVVLYELLCNQRPFQGETEPAVLYELVSRSPQPLARYRRDATEELERIVTKCLAKSPDERYQSCADFVTDLRAEEKSLSSVVTTGRTGESQRRTRLNLVISASLVGLAALAVFLFKPWQIEFAPRKEAAAEGNRLAVMYFDNLADPADIDNMGEIAANLVISDLSASSHLQIVSGQRLYDALKLMGKEGSKRIDRETASHVAEKVKARWMLTGSILRMEPSIVLNAQLIDVESGSVFASPTVTGTPGDDLFTVVDSLTRRTRELVAHPEIAVHDREFEVSSLTTKSTDAYRHYLRGWDLYYQDKFTEATSEFGKAIAADTTFALAYYAQSYAAEGYGTVQYEMIEKARQYIDDLSDHDRQLILARDMWLKGEYDQAIKYFNEVLEDNPDDKYVYHHLASIYYDYPFNDYVRAIKYSLEALRIDSLFTFPYSTLAFSYISIDAIDKAIWAIDKFVELAPDKPVSYDTRGWLFGLMGKVDEAIASFQKALDLDSLFTNSISGLVCMYTFNSEFDKAERILQRNLKDPNRDVRLWARAERTRLSLYMGKLDEALARAQYEVEAQIVEYGAERGYVGASYTLRFLYEDLLELTGQVVWAESLRVLNDRRSLLIRQDSSSSGRDNAETCYDRAIYASLIGDKSTVDSNLFAYAEQLNATGFIDSADYGFALAFVNFNMENYDTAIAYFMDYGLYDDSYDSELWLGRAYLNAGRPDKAVEHLERALRRYDWRRFVKASATVRLHYWLGQAYEQSSWREKAIEQYETFLEIWKNADEKILDLEDARQRLARLRTQLG